MWHCASLLYTHTQLYPPLLCIFLSFIPATSDIMFQNPLPSPPPSPRISGRGLPPVFLFSRSLSKSWLHVWWVEGNISDWYISPLSTASQQVWGCSVSTWQSECGQRHTNTCKHINKERWQVIWVVLYPSSDSAVKVILFQYSIDSKWHLQEVTSISRENIAWLHMHINKLNLTQRVKSIINACMSCYSALPVTYGRKQPTGS